MKSKGLSVLLIVAGLCGLQAGALADDAGRVQQWLLAGRFSDPPPAKLLAKDGAATLTIATALNEAVGTWKVKVAHLASGVVGEATFEVK